MTELRATDLIVAARIATGLVGLTAVTSLIVHLAAADEARELLGFTFDGLPRRLGQSLDIFANNVRVLGSVLAACSAVQLAQRVSLAPVLWVCDAALSTGCAIHVLVIGAAFGGYGLRTLNVVLAHAPFELAAFSLALGLYLEARRGRLTPRRLFVTALVSGGALAIGSLLEVFA